MSLCRNSDWVWNPPFPRNYCTHKKKITARSRPDNREIRIKGGRIREVELYPYCLCIMQWDGKELDTQFTPNASFCQTPNSKILAKALFPSGHDSTNNADLHVHKLYCKPAKHVLTPINNDLHYIYSSKVNDYFIFLFVL